MRDTLQWNVRGESFEDGSRFTDWFKVDESGTWHWQYDDHELTFDIYAHDGQFWKLYRARFVRDGDDDYTYRFGGQACRMAHVAYTRRSRSPHSGRLMLPGDLEWVRTYEVDPAIHRVIRADGEDASIEVARSANGAVS